MMPDPRREYGGVPAETHAEGLLADNLRLQAALNTAELRRLRLEDELEGLREDAGRLAEQLEHERADRDRVESTQGELVRLCVAALHLHGSLETARVLAALREVLADSLACDAYALLEPGGVPGEPAVADAAGLEPAELRGLPGHPGVERALAGEWWTAAAPAEGGPSVCVPLRLEGRPAGALALFGLPAHGAGLSPGERRLLEVLSTSAPMALHAARLHAVAACPVG